MPLPHYPFPRPPGPSTSQALNYRWNGEGTCRSTSTWLTGLMRNRIYSLSCRPSLRPRAYRNWPTGAFYRQLLWEPYQSQNTTSNASGSQPRGQADLGAGREDRTPTQLTLPVRPCQLLQTITNTRLELVAASYATSHNPLPFQV